MKLLQINPFDLKPNPWNSNRMDRENFEKLKLSLSKIGNFKPVIARNKGDELEILAGYHRTEAAKELGLTEIPVLTLGVIDDQRAKEISIIDNTRYGLDDEKLLEDLINSMDIELISKIIPEQEEIIFPEIEDLSKFEEEVLKSDDRKTEYNEDFKILKFRYDDLDKSDEIEDLLLSIAKEHEYYHSDGYPNLSDALYHALILEKKNV